MNWRNTLFLFTAAAGLLAVIFGLLDRTWWLIPLGMVAAVFGLAVCLVVIAMEASRESFIERST